MPQAIRAKHVANDLIVDRNGTIGNMKPIPPMGSSKAMPPRRCLLSVS
ncbi:unnamed protein product [Tuwongella immobilis]|uniref:Uncharacterized protein n=1 Tax=Tuwongella immobilis TaxID=692036 RepID=A0A6C2YLR7_9BACT|nr:unnamed protein product [Tuwongella immobilis]VTS01643.1 unnamed protein product [Tuwongella immobilis]